MISAKHCVKPIVKHVKFLGNAWRKLFLLLVYQRFQAEIFFFEFSFREKLPQ